MHSKSTGLLIWLLRTVQVYSTVQEYRTGYYRSLLDPGKAEEGRRSQSLKTGEESLVDIIEEAGVESLAMVESNIREAETGRSVKTFLWNL